MKKVFFLLFFFYNFISNAQYITIEKSNELFDDLIAMDFLTPEARDSIISKIETSRLKRAAAIAADEVYSFSYHEDPLPRVFAEDLNNNHDRLSEIIYYLRLAYLAEFRYRINYYDHMQLVAYALAAQQKPLNSSTYGLVADSLRSELKELTDNHPAFKIEQQIRPVDKRQRNIYFVPPNMFDGPPVENSKGGFISKNRSVTGKQRTESWKTLYEIGVFSDETFEHGQQLIDNKETYINFIHLLSDASEMAKQKESFHRRHYRQTQQLTKWKAMDIVTSDEISSIQAAQGRYSFTDRFEYLAFMSNSQTYDLNAFNELETADVFKKIYTGVHDVLPYLTIKVISVKPRASNEWSAKIKINGQATTIDFTAPPNTIKNKGLYFTNTALKPINNYLQSTKSSYRIYIANNNARSKKFGFIALTTAQKNTIISYDGDTFLVLP